MSVREIQISSCGADGLPRVKSRSGPPVLPFSFALLPVFLWGSPEGAWVCLLTFLPDFCRRAAEGWVEPCRMESLWPPTRHYGQWLVLLKNMQLRQKRKFDFIICLVSWPWSEYGVILSWRFPFFSSAPISQCWLGFGQALWFARVPVSLLPQVSEARCYIQCELFASYILPHWEIWVCGQLWKSALTSCISIFRASLEHSSVIQNLKQQSRYSSPRPPCWNRPSLVVLALLGIYSKR